MTFFLFQAASPSAGQFTALGIYLLICLFFVVGAMIEFAILLHLKRRAEENLLKENFTTEGYNGKVDTDVTTSSDLLGRNENATIKLVGPISKSRSTFLATSNKIDNYAFVGFMSLFSAFNAIYWSYYLLI